MDKGDTIESFTFEYPNLKRQTTTRIPNALTGQIERLSNVLEIYDAISGVTTMKMGQDVDCDKLKQLSTVVTMCTDNAFELSVKFRKHGLYKCNESVVAKYDMNDVVISHFKDYTTPDMKTPEHDMEAWLDDVSDKIKEIEDKGRNEIPTKPKK